MTTEAATQTTPGIDDFIDALWLEDGLSKNTLEAYRRDMRLFATWLEKKRPEVGGLLAVAAHDIQGYIAARHEEYASGLHDEDGHIH